MTTPTYGLIFNETETAPYAVVAGDSSVIGLVLCQDDANPTAFPLNAPTMFNSSDPAFISAATGSTPKIGATGDLAKAVAAINNQLAQFESAATIIVVPVARVTAGSGSAPLAAATDATYSYGTVACALNVSAAAYLNVGDEVSLVIFMHSSSNDDTGDYAYASLTGLSIVKAS